MTPVLALAGLAAIGLLATQLPRPPQRYVRSLDWALAGGAPLVLLGLVLGPGIDLIDGPMLRALAPVTALALGWIGASFAARCEWRYVRRIPRGVWLLALVSAGAVFVAVALGAWLLARQVPALGAAWAPRLPTVLALAAVATVSGPGAVMLVARTLAIRRRVAHAFGRAAALETACGALLMTVPLALHRPHPPAAHAALGWLYWIVFVIGSGALVGLVFLSLTRSRPAPQSLSFALLGVVLFGAGIGFAADLSPFLVCALAAVVIVNWSPHRRRVRALLSDWGHPSYAVFLVITGALLTLPTAGMLVAVPVLAALRVGARWASARYARPVLGLRNLPPHVGLATTAQGVAALALGLDYFLTPGAPSDTGARGAVLTTVVLGVAVAQLAAAPLMRLALRPAAAPLTPAPAGPELTSNAVAE